jgi:hypothetical protein
MSSSRLIPAQLPPESYPLSNSGDSHAPSVQTVSRSFDGRRDWVEAADVSERFDNINGEEVGCGIFRYVGIAVTFCKKNSFDISAQVTLDIINCTRSNYLG